MFGDMGADNPKALPRLRRDTQQGMFDAVLHVGEAPTRVLLEAGELGAQRSSARMGWGWGGSEGTGFAFLFIIIRGKARQEHTDML